MKRGSDIFEREGRTHVRVWGRTPRELAAEALHSLAVVLRPDLPHRDSPRIRIRLRVRGSSFPEVLSKFLAQALFEAEFHRALFPEIRVIHASEQEIEGELIGTYVGHFENEIEAVEILHCAEATPLWAEFVCETS